MKKSMLFIFLWCAVLAQAAAGGGGAAGVRPRRLDEERILAKFEGTVFLLYENALKISEAQADVYNARDGIDAIVTNLNQAFRARQYLPADGVDELNSRNIDFIYNTSFEALTFEQKNLCNNIAIANTQESAYCLQRLYGGEVIERADRFVCLERARLCTEQMGYVLFPGIVSFLQRAYLQNGSRFNKDFVMNEQDYKTLMAWYEMKARLLMIYNLEVVYDDEDDEDDEDEVAEDEDEVAQKDPNPENAD